MQTNVVVFQKIGVYLKDKERQVLSKPKGISTESNAQQLLFVMLHLKPNSFV